MVVGSPISVPHQARRGINCPKILQKAFPQQFWFSVCAFRPIILKMSTCLKIGTHNGKFHCDEVMACFILKKLPEFQNATIVRSRDPETLSQCDIVVDVGGVYNHELKRYDHHQRDFDKTMNSIRPEKPFDIIKLSSVGLVFAHYGEQFIKTILSPLTLSDEIINKIFDRVYEKFILELDAIDNGIEIYDGEMRYSIHTNLSARVGQLNPNWNDVDQDETKGFAAAMELTGTELIHTIKFYANVWLPARSIILTAIEERNTKNKEESQIITLKTFCPWSSHLFELEKEMNLDPTIKYALFQDKNETWRVRAVNDSEASFGLRVPLPEAWRGFRDEELSKLSGIPDCIFVHMSGFIGGNKTYEGAYQMAMKSLQMATTEKTAKMEETN